MFPRKAPVKGNQGSPSASKHEAYMEACIITHCNLTVNVD